MWSLISLLDRQDRCAQKLLCVLAAAGRDGPRLDAGEVKLLGFLSKLGNRVPAATVGTFRGAAALGAQRGAQACEAAFPTCGYSRQEMVQRAKESARAALAARAARRGTQ